MKPRLILMEQSYWIVLVDPKLTKSSFM